MAEESTDRHVILLHGLFRSRFSLLLLQKALKDAGYTVHNVGYASSRRSIPEHAARLAEKLEAELEGASGTLNFVTHSMGGIVTRAYLASHEPPLPVKRVVMLAPPNQGAQLAERLKNLWIWSLVGGESGRQLARDEVGPAEMFGRFPVPEDVELGIIAGGTGDKKGYAPWIEGDNDGVVAVEETRHSSARDHILLPHVHTFIMNAKSGIANVIAFLDEGRFLDEAPRLAPAEGAREDSAREPAS